jgi:hypothetical protein
MSLEEEAIETRAMIDSKAEEETVRIAAIITEEMAEIVMAATVQERAEVAAMRNRDMEVIVEKAEIAGITEEETEIEIVIAEAAMTETAEAQEEAIATVETETIEAATEETEETEEIEEIEDRTIGDKAEARDMTTTEEIEGTTTAQTIEEEMMEAGRTRDPEVLCSNNHKEEMTPGDSSLESRFLKVQVGASLECLQWELLSKKIIELMPGDRSLEMRILSK